MTADQNFHSGGDGAILALFQHNQPPDSDNSLVNELIISCASSKDSLSKLYNMFKKDVFSLAFSIISDFQLAEDCVTETFVRLTQINRFDPKKGDGKGFILTIARNVALELRRKYKKDCMAFIFQSYGEADKTVEDSIYINQLLSSLSDKQRQIVVLRVCSQLTFKEIAKIMKCPETTAKSRFQKAIAILKEKAGADYE